MQLSSTFWQHRHARTEVRALNQGFDGVGAQPMRPENQAGGGGRSQEGCAASASRPVAASFSAAAPARSWRAVTRERFLLRETRIVAGLMQEGLSAQEILARVQEENAFQYPTKASLGNICRTCLMRLDALGAAGPELTRVIATAPLTQAAQTNLYAMMRAYAVVWEFMTRVVAYKYRTLDYHLALRDVSAFLTDLAAEEPAVAAWSPATVARTRSTLRDLLAESGYLASARSEELLPIAPERELIRAIRANGDACALAAFNCMEVA